MRRGSKILRGVTRGGGGGGAIVVSKPRINYIKSVKWYSNSNSNSHNSNNSEISNSNKSENSNSNYSAALSTRHQEDHEGQRKLRTEPRISKDWSVPAIKDNMGNKRYEVVRFDPNNPKHLEARMRTQNAHYQEEIEHESRKITKKKKKKKNNFKIFKNNF